MSAIPKWVWKLLIGSATFGFIILGVEVFLYHSILMSPYEDTFFNPEAFAQEIGKCNTTGERLRARFWKKVDLRRRKIPDFIIDFMKTIDVQSDSVLVEGLKVHYLHSKVKARNSLSVLLLHGQSFTAETWNELGTIRLLSALGFNPIAVDLPGFGETPKKYVHKAPFMDNLISELNLTRPVLVSPSLSGSYSLPYLLKYPRRLGGFVPISPVHTSALSKSLCRDFDDYGIESTLTKDCRNIMRYLEFNRPLKLNCIKVPSLIVWGEQDRAENSAKLCLLPESQGFEIPKGKHAAYLSNPGLWHELLYNFLDVVNSTQACY